MTRMTHLLSALSLTCVLTGAMIAACGSHPGSPGELPPVAPRPGPVSVRSVPSPTFAPVVGEAAKDAGTSDGYAPPLPPMPDGGVPGDSRLDPR